METVSIYNETRNHSDNLYLYDDSYNLELSEPYRTIVLILHWCIPVMILASVFGNVLIIAIMCMPNNRNASTSVFFVALAMSDMFLMVFVSLERWLYSLQGTILFGTAHSMALIKVITENSSVQISSWILSMITIERVICLVVPHRFKNICTARVASLVVVLTCIIVIALNIICFSVLIDAAYFDEIMLYTDRFEGGLAIFSWLDFVVGFSLPFVIIFVGTILIVFRIFNLKGNDLRSNRNSVLQTLVAVNIVFLVTMSPYRLLYILYPDADPADIPRDVFEVYHEAVISLADLNSTLNFYIYVLSGKRFREDIKRLFCRRCC